MRLRGRFAVALVAAAVAPIAVATVIVVQALTARDRAEYRSHRAHAERQATRELERLTAGAAEVAAALANQDHPFIGTIVRELNSGDDVSPNSRRRWGESAEPTMRSSLLDVLTVTGPDGVVVVSPHDRGRVGDVDPSVRQRAEATGGKPFFALDTISTGHAVTKVVVAQSVRVVPGPGAVFAIAAGRRVTDEVLRTVRRADVIDARLVLTSGDVVLPPANPAQWSQKAARAPIRIALVGAAGSPMAYVEIAIYDRGIEPFLAAAAAPALLLAFGALLAVVWLGLWITRRTTRDLGHLVDGATAAARGELDYRVAVRSDDEVGAVAKAFNFMMEDLQVAKERLVIAERIAAWQDIARRVAHEIKNPLTPIQMAMDTLRKGWAKQHPQFGEILDESTTTVLEEATRLRRIVAEFSDFARMPKPEFSRMDLNDVVRASLALYQDAKPSVEAVLDPALPELFADKSQLGQVLLNLVENAREALGNADRGRIVVTTRRGETADRVVLAVEDNGPGVPVELRDKVFTPYFTTKIAQGGTGLGLAIVHRIISDHGGRIAISSPAGGGTRIAIELPLRGGVALLASRA